MQKPAPASSSFEDLVGQVALCRENLVERGWLDPRVAADPPDRWHQKGDLSRKERTLFISITRVAMRCYDSAGVSLVKQILDHIGEALAGIRENYVVDWQYNQPCFTPAPDREAVLLSLVNNIVIPRNHFASLVRAGFPHPGFVIILDDICDEVARVVRREIVRRLLHSRIDGKVAVEMLAVLQKDLDSGAWATPTRTWRNGSMRRRPSRSTCGKPDASAGARLVGGRGYWGKEPSAGLCGGFRGPRIPGLPPFERCEAWRN
jgi:hypothetical protein